MDAYCLIEIFDFLMKRTIELNMKIDFHLLIGKKLKIPAAAKSKIKEAKVKNKLNNVKNVEEKEPVEVIKKVFQILPVRHCYNTPKVFN